MGIGLFAMPENALSAMAGSNVIDAPHVRVKFEQPVPVGPRTKFANGRLAVDWRNDAIPRPRIAPQPQRAVTAVERPIAGVEVVDAGSPIDGGPWLDTRAVRHDNGFPLPPTAFVAGLAIAAAPCTGDLGRGCEWPAAPQAPLPKLNQFLVVSRETALGVGDDGLRSRPNIEYLPFPIDGDVGASFLMRGFGRGASERLAVTFVASSSVPQVPEEGSGPLGTELSSPLGEEQLPFLPEPSVVISEVALRARDLGPAEVSSLTLAGRGLSADEEGPASIAGDVGRLVSGTFAGSLTQVEDPEEQLLRDAVFGHGATEASRNGLLIPLPAPGTVVAGNGEAPEPMVFGLTGGAARSVANALTAPRLVQLRSVIAALSQRFDAPELQRMATSSAADLFVPIDRLGSAGIWVADELFGDGPSGEPATSNWAMVQSEPMRSGAGGVNGALSGGSGDHGLKQSLTATASAGFDSNPFLSQLADPEAASLRLQLVPALARTGERGTFRLSGRLEHIEYLGQYESLQNYGADLAASRKLSERLDVQGGLTFRSDILATNLGNPFGIVDAGTGNPVPPAGNDVTILGQGQRRTQYGLEGGLTYDLSDRDQLRWSASARADRFGSANLVDSNFLAQRLQYLRRLDEDVTIGAAIDANLIDFTGSDLEGAQTVSPQLQVNAALTPRLTLSASAGLAITRLEFLGREDTTTAVAGDASLCHKGERSSFCVNGSRQVLPAAIGGALLQTTAGFSYSLRLSERDTVQLSGNYGTASQPIAATVGDFESINGSARYERQLNERMRLFVSGGALRTSGNLPTNVTNIQGLIGITMNFGQTR